MSLFARRAPDLSSARACPHIRERRVACLQVAARVSARPRFAVARVAELFASRRGFANHRRASHASQIRRRRTQRADSAPTK